MKLNEKDAKEYKRYLKELRDIASEQHTKMADAQDIIKKAKDEKEMETVLKLRSKGKSNQEISDLLDLQIGRVIEIIGSQSNK